MADLIFYTNPMSRGQTVRWMLEEVGQPYETEILDYATTLKAEPYLSINPMGKIPAIKHKGKVVTEVAAICCYLADAFPEANLAPPTDQRADYYRWIFFTSGPVEAAFSNKAADSSCGIHRVSGNDVGSSLAHCLESTCNCPARSCRRC